VLVEWRNAIGGVRRCEERTENVPHLPLLR